MLNFSNISIKLFLYNCLSFGISIKICGFNCSSGRRVGTLTLPPIELQNFQSTDDEVADAMHSTTEDIVHVTELPGSPDLFKIKRRIKTISESSSPRTMSPLLTQPDSPLIKTKEIKKKYTFKTKIDVFRTPKLNSYTEETVFPERGCMSESDIDVEYEHFETKYEPFDKQSSVSDSELFNKDSHDTTITADDTYLPSYETQNRHSESSTASSLDPSLVDKRKKITDVWGISKYVQDPSITYTDFNISKPDVYDVDIQTEDDLTHFGHLMRFIEEQRLAALKYKATYSVKSEDGRSLTEEDQETQYDPDFSHLDAELGDTPQDSTTEVVFSPPATQSSDPNDNMAAMDEALVEYLSRHGDISHYAWSRGNVTDDQKLTGNIQPLPQSEGIAITLKPPDEENVTNGEIKAGTKDIEIQTEEGLTKYTYLINLVQEQTNIDEKHEHKTVHMHKTFYQTFENEEIRSQNEQGVQTEDELTQYTILIQNSKKQITIMEQQERMIKDGQRPDDRASDKSSEDVSEYDNVDYPYTVEERPAEYETQLSPSHGPLVTIYESTDSEQDNVDKKSEQFDKTEELDKTPTAIDEQTFYYGDSRTHRDTRTDTTKYIYETATHYVEQDMERGQMTEDINQRMPVKDTETQDAECNTDEVEKSSFETQTEDIVTKYYYMVHTCTHMMENTDASNTSYVYSGEKHEEDVDSVEKETEDSGENLIPEEMAEGSADEIIVEEDIEDNADDMIPKEIDSEEELPGYTEFAQTIEYSKLTNVGDSIDGESHRPVDEEFEIHAGEVVETQTDDDLTHYNDLVVMLQTKLLSVSDDASSQTEASVVNSFTNTEIRQFDDTSQQTNIQDVANQGINTDKIKTMQFGSQTGTELLQMSQNESSTNTDAVNKTEICTETDLIKLTESDSQTENVKEIETVESSTDAYKIDTSLCETQTDPVSQDQFHLICSSEEREIFRERTSVEKSKYTFIQGGRNDDEDTTNKATECSEESVMVKQHSERMDIDSKPGNQSITDTFHEIHRNVGLKETNQQDKASRLPDNMNKEWSYEHVETQTDLSEFIDFCSKEVQCQMYDNSLDKENEIQTDDDITKQIKYLQSIQVKEQKETKHATHVKEKEFIESIDSIQKDVTAVDTETQTEEALSNYEEYNLLLQRVNTFEKEKILIQERVERERTEYIEMYEKQQREKKASMKDKTTDTRHILTKELRRANTKAIQTGKELMENLKKELLVIVKKEESQKQKDSPIKDSESNVSTDSEYAEKTLGEFGEHLTEKTWVTVTDTKTRYRRKVRESHEEAEFADSESEPGLDTTCVEIIDGIPQYDYIINNKETQTEPMEEETLKEHSNTQTEDDDYLQYLAYLKTVKRQTRTSSRKSGKTREKTEPIIFEATEFDVTEDAGMEIVGQGVDEADLGIGARRETREGTGEGYMRSKPKRLTEILNVPDEEEEVSKTSTLTLHIPRASCWSYLCRLFIPFQLFFFLILCLACLIPWEDEEFLCIFRNELQDPTHTLLKYPYGSPPV